MTVFVIAPNVEITATRVPQTNIATRRLTSDSCISGIPYVQQVAHAEQGIFLFRGNKRATAAAGSGIREPGQEIGDLDDRAMNRAATDLFCSSAGVQLSIGNDPGTHPHNVKAAIEGVQLGARTNP